MADAGAIKAGEAFVSITASDAQLRRDLPAIQARWANTIAMMQTAGAALSFGFLARAATGAIDAAGLRGRAIFDRAQENDIPTEQAARLAAAAHEANISLDTLANGLDNLSRVGSIRQLDAIAARINAIGDAGERAEAIARTFGTRADFGPFLQALERVGDGRALAQQAAEANATVQAFDRLRYALSSVGTTFGAVLGPAVRPAVDMLTRAAVGVRAWTERNPELVQSLALVGGAIGIVGGGMAVIAAGSMVAGVAVRGLAAAFGAVRGALSLVGAVATSPWTLMIAGAGAAGVAFARLTDSGRQLTDTLGSTFRTTWGGIVDAVKSGELEMAFQIAAAGIKTIWSEMLSWMNRETYGVFEWIWRTSQEGWTNFFGWMNDLITGTPIGTTNQEIRLHDERVRRHNLAFPPETARAELDRLREEARRRVQALSETTTASTAHGPSQQQNVIARGLFAAQAAFGLIGGSPTDRTEGYQRTMVAELQGLRRDLHDLPVAVFG